MSLGDASKRGCGRRGSRSGAGRTSLERSELGWIAPSLCWAAMLLVAGAACAPAAPRRRDPLGQMPTAVTKAQPEWIPFQVRAGHPADSDPRERHFKDVRQLTFDGNSSRARFAPDGRRIVFQSTRDGDACDQIYLMDLGDGATRRPAAGARRAREVGACFAWPDGLQILYASTHATGVECARPPGLPPGDLWALDDADLYRQQIESGEPMPLVASPGYDGEVTSAPDGTRIVFTSTRDGDAELYTAGPDGSDIRRITNAAGHDGGAAFSPDSSKLAWSASRPRGAKELEEHRQSLARKLVSPAQLEIWVGGAEGQRGRAVTRLGSTSIAPAFLPDSKRIVFASNVDSAPLGGNPTNFELYVIDTDAPPTQDGMPPLERLTFNEDFDGSPAFSPDGEHIVFTSGRSGIAPGGSNLFVARWID